jgi:predicted Zn-dependent protease
MRRPDKAKAAVSVRQRARPRRTLVKLAMGSAVLAAVAGCASLSSDAEKVWKVEPVLNVTHAMSSSSAYYALGRYHDGSQAWDKAIDAYRKAIILDTQNIDAYNALGVALARAGRYDAAEATLRQALAIAPDKHHVRNNLGYVLLLAGKPDDAVRELKSTLKQDPGSSIAMANLREALARSEATLAAAPPPNPCRRRPCRPSSHRRRRLSPRRTLFRRSHFLPWPRLRRRPKQPWLWRPMPCCRARGRPLKSSVPGWR